MIIDETNPDDFEQETAIGGEPDETEIEAGSEEAEFDDDPDTEGAEAEATDEAGTEEGDDGPEIEYAEIELNGKKYQVPAELKDGYLMQADYTRKTQAAAEKQREVEAEKASVEAMRQATEEELAARATILGINQRLDEYRKLGPHDWNAWEDEDPMAAQRGFREFQTLQQQAGQATEYLQNAERQRTEKMQQETAKRHQETRDFAVKSIPGWNADMHSKITEFATKDLGWTEPQLVQSISPVAYKTLHLAWVGHQALEKSKTAKPKPQAQVKPLSQVIPKGSRIKRPVTELEMDEYADHMNRLERQRASR